MKKLNTQNINNQQGFTLIELVVVIVILGILAATAAPKFLNLQDDARTATINAVEGAMKSAATLVHARSLIDGTEKKGTGETVTMGTSQSIDIAFGYPTSDDAADWEELLDVDDFTVVVVGDYIVVHPTDLDAPTTVDTAATTGCYAYYEAVGAVGGLPVIGSVVCSD